MEHRAEQRAATLPPIAEDMLRIWRADRCVRDSSAGLYLQWIKRFRAYCARQELDERAELTLSGARCFIAWYAQLRRLDPKRLGSARTALHALSRVYQVMELQPPAWQPLEPIPLPATMLLRDYATHLARHRGNPETTVHKKLAHIGKLSEHLAASGKAWTTMTLTDIDTFLIGCAGRYARSTVADIAGSIRCFARFLLASGRISIELAEAVISPMQAKLERPRRALPWKDVQRLIRSIDTASSGGGLRDHALLLLMSTYGFGAGEVIRLRLQDIDWKAATLKIVRPKTGVALTLPLLPPAAKALALYLRDGRPPQTPTRHVFVCMRMPFDSLRTSSAIRHIVVKHAKAAGLNAPYLGSHVLRHANAARHVDLGIRPQVLSDLLGHRDPASISAYVRIATETLRDVSLPVPT